MHVRHLFLPLLFGLLPAMAEAATAPSDKPMLSIENAPDGPAGLVSADPPALRFANLWTDPAGRSHIATCQLKGFVLRSYAPPAAPQWLGIPPGDIKSISFGVLPVGYVGAWHHAPGPQWVVTLSGRWSVQTVDGTVLTQGPGEAQFNADMGARPDRPGGPVGHLTRTVGDVPNVQMIIALKQMPHGAASGPCF